MNNNNNSNTTTELESYFDEELVTPYAIIRKLNQLTKRDLPTQMGYNYVRKGFIPSVEVDGKRLVHNLTASAWIQKYLDKNVK